MARGSRLRQPWDAGCGNGQASAALAGYFDSVYASDQRQVQVRTWTESSMTCVTFAFAGLDQAVNRRRDLLLDFDRVATSAFQMRESRVEPGLARTVRWPLLMMAGRLQLSI